MPLFGRRRVETEAQEEHEVPVVVPGTRFEGAGYCFREGFFYPLLNDEHGMEAGPDLGHPLVWKLDADHPSGGYVVHASPEDPNHFHQYGINAVELEVAPRREQE